jgi:hypothetical protein
MRSRKAQILAITAALVIALPFGMRQIFGRNRADLAAFFSIDDGTLWTFSRTYHDGRVGPFNIGESRQALKVRLLSPGLLDQEDKPQLFGTAPEWRFGLPARIGGYIIYTIKFDGDRVASVQSFYSAFAGL